MGDSKLERRLAGLEQELADLRKKVDKMTSNEPWWERIAGTFQDDAIYKQAMRLGQQYRRSQKPNGRKGK